MYIYELIITIIRYMVPWIWCHKSINWWFCEGRFFKISHCSSSAERSIPDTASHYWSEMSFTAKDFTIAEACSSINDFFLGILDSERNNKQIKIYAVTCKALISMWNKMKYFFLRIKEIFHVEISMRYP